MARMKFTLTMLCRILAAGAKVSCKDTDDIMRKPLGDSCIAL